MEGGRKEGGAGGVPAKRKAEQQMALRARPGEKRKRKPTEK